MTAPAPYEDIKYQRFNESIDEQGEFPIAHVSFLPSRILYEMDIEAYKEAYADFKEDEYEELKEVIYNQYPSCIAYNFRLSEKGEGANDPVRKLLHLKDTWESIVFVLYAVVLGEVRYKAINLQAVEIFETIAPNGNPVYKKFNTGTLLSDAIKTKIKSLIAIIEHSKASTLALKCELIPIELLQKLLELQDVRNDISHHAAPTKEEAEDELKKVVPLFKEMLLLSEFMADCKILRFESYAVKCKCEEFNGHALNKEFDDYDFNDSQAYVLTLGQEHLFLKWDTDIFSLSPFLHFERDLVGRESYLSFFKGKKGGKYWFEPITKRYEISFDTLQPRFDSEQIVLFNLIVP